LFLKISLCRPVLANRCKQILQLIVGNRCARCDGHQGASKEDPTDEDAHAPSYATAPKSQSASLALLAAKPFAIFSVDNRS
jgi:hypothetical protein